MENIKNTLRKFAQFYGEECWHNGKHGIKELPSGEEFIDIYTKELMDILNKPVDELTEEQRLNKEIENFIKKVKENSL